MRTHRNYFTGVNSSEDQKKRKSDLTEIGEKVTTFFWDDAPEHGFEMREGQQDMSFEIVDALIHNQHFAVEAGVGIGKSFGYLVPVLLYNRKMRKPVIVATSTIALQEQLWNDIQDILQLLKFQTEVTLVKGQTHYLCNKRLDEFLSKKDIIIPEELREGIEQGFQERKEFSTSLQSDIWSKVNIQRFSMRNCGSCNKKCRYYMIRSKLKQTKGIILCNQDFLTAHLLQLRRGSDGLITREVDLIVVDEAHNLDDKVRSATTEHIDQGMLLNLIRRATNEIKSVDRQKIYSEEEKAKKAVHVFFGCLQDQIQRQIREGQQDMRYAVRFFFDGSRKNIDLLNSMTEAISRFAFNIQLYTSFGFQQHHQAGDSDDLDAICESLTEITNNLGNTLLWIERRGRDAELVYCPKNTKRITNWLYFSGSERTILTSATLTNTNKGSLEEQYSYFISNTGFPIDEHGCLSEPKPSPYPYDEHSIIYYCDDLPHPTREHDAFIEKGVQRLLDVLSISNGKALVLFTSKTDMEEVYSILRKKDLPYKILMQQSGPSQEKVLNEFKEDINSVLFGTGAYWEGISIEGKSLSNVVIFRLPFPVPDPIIEYKASIAQDALMDVRVPEMVIKLKQGIGRLIRNFTDTGIVCIIDRRLRDNSPERYHDIVWESLPIKKKTNRLDELRIFYENLSITEK